MEKSKKSQLGFGTIEFFLLAGLLAILAMFMIKELTCPAIQLLLSVRLPFAGSGPNTALCANTEAVTFTQATFSSVMVGLGLFVCLVYHLSRRRG